MVPADARREAVPALHRLDRPSRKERLMKWWRRSKNSSLDAQPVQIRWYIANQSLPTAMWMLAILLMLFALFGADSMRK